MKESEIKCRVEALIDIMMDQVVIEIFHGFIRWEMVPIEEFGEEQ